MAPPPFLDLIKRNIPNSAQVVEYATDTYLTVLGLPPTKVKRADDSKSTSTPVHVTASPIPWKSGSVKASDFSKGILVIFCLLGAGLALGAWWFFAKRGGFVWQKDDWEDYKSTVMRKRDENGNTIGSWSSRGSRTVTTDVSYQQETYYDGEDARTEKSRATSHRSANKKAAALGAIKKLKPKWGRKRTGMSEATERTSYEEYDRDLESYADEEPARMASYNPHPVNAPSVMDGSEMSEREVRDNGAGAYRPDRHPSRYSYAYTSSEISGIRSNADRSERSGPLGPRKPTVKGSGGTTKSKRQESRAHRNTYYQERDLSTIEDEGESRLSFEAEDDAAFSVSAASTKLTGHRTSRAYQKNPPKKQPQQRQPPAVQQRVTSHGTYRSTGTSSGEECDSDCSCCTTESESETEETGPSSRGDLGTKVYHHPLGLGISGGGKLMKPADALVVNKARGGTPVKSYRKDSRGSLSSDDSEGEGSIVESSISAPSSRMVASRR